MIGIIISRTPFRISFLGGGTDYRPFFSEYGGSVISTAVNKYTTINISETDPLLGYRNQLIYRATEVFNSPDELKHPTAREILKLTGIDGYQIIYYGDLPARSGMATSSAFAVGLLNAAYTLKGVRLSPMELARLAIKVERELCAEAGGMQDQIISALGGFNRINFKTVDGADKYDVAPLNISRERKDFFLSHLMLFFTGTTRMSSAVAADQVKNMNKRKKELLEMLPLVDEGQKVLEGEGSVKDFGRLLNEAWALKRSFADSVSTGDIDGIYEKAVKAGALGGKILGAGGGGFMLIFAEPDKQPGVLAALDGLTRVNFDFEDKGAEIIYNKAGRFYIC
ncbi:MAG: kinase [Oscillospiraceae bacterium]|nr:kinase [Oscillospiraceae bacterium]